VFRNAMVPDFTATSYEQLQEWIGLACIQADRLRVNDKVDPFISRYSLPETCIHGDIYITRIRGFISPEVIIEFIASINSRYKKNDGFWMALNVHGFDNNPFVWGKFRDHGENNYLHIYKNGKSTTFMIKT
jgi:hypothetical protein